MKFHAIKWVNLLSTGAEPVVMRLDQFDQTLLMGKNGSGKSTLLDAICFALFNKPFRKINKNQLINSVNKKGTLVELAFSAGNHTYVIRRGIKPNIFEIYKDKQLIDQAADNRDYQDYLEKNIIGRSFRTFCQVDILGSATFIPFMQLPPAQRREVVEDLLDSHVYSIMQQLAKAEVKALLEDYRKTDSNIQIWKGHIAAQQKLLNRQAEDKSALIERLDERIAKIAEEMDVTEASMARDHTEVLTIQDQIDAIGVDPAKVEKTRGELQTDIRNSELQIQAIERRVAKTDIDVCPTCLQKVDENHREHIKADGEKDKEHHLKLITLSKTRLEKVNALWNKISNLKGKQDRLKASANQAFTSLKYARDNLVSLENEKTVALDKRNEVIDVNELKELQEEHALLIDQYDAQAKKLELLKQCVAQLGDDGIKAKLVNKYIPIINQSVNEYLEAMDLFVQFELDETFNETIKSRYRDVFTYASFSEGEKLRINLAILFTWRRIAAMRNSVSSNLLIMDEVLDGSLDDNGISDLMQVFRKLSETQNLFVISHKTSVMDGFDNVILAEKCGNFTSYNKI